MYRVCLAVVVNYFTPGGFENFRLKWCRTNNTFKGSHANTSIEEKNYERQRENENRDRAMNHHMKLLIEASWIQNILGTLFKTHKIIIFVMVFFAYVFISKYPYFPNSQPMVMSSYCTIYTRYIDYIFFPSSSYFFIQA